MRRSRGNPAAFVASVALENNQHLLTVGAVATPLKISNVYGNDWRGCIAKTAINSDGWGGLSITKVEESSGRVDHQEPVRAKEPSAI